MRTRHSLTILMANAMLAYSSSLVGTLVSAWKRLCSSHHRALRSQACDRKASRALSLSVSAVPKESAPNQAI